MVHIITSFSKLKDIIHLENTCKLFNSICKWNTYEMMEYKNFSNNLYTRYIKCHDNNKPFKLSHIKHLRIFLDNKTDIELLTPIIKHHTNLSYFYLSFSCWYEDVHCLTNEFAQNIPGNVFINYLTFDDCWNDLLIDKVCDIVCFEDIHLSKEKFEKLSQLQIKHLILDDCECDDDIHEISLKEWHSLKKCEIEFEDIYKKLFTVLLKDPPNLSHVKITDIYGAATLPNKISKSIEILEICLYDPNIVISQIVTNCYLIILKIKIISLNL